MCGQYNITDSAFQRLMQTHIPTPLLLLSILSDAESSFATELLVMRVSLVAHLFQESDSTIPPDSRDALKVKFHQGTDRTLGVDQVIAQAEFVVPVLVFNAGIKHPGITPEVAHV